MAHNLDVALWLASADIYVFPVDWVDHEWVNGVSTKCEPRRKPLVRWGTQSSTSSVQIKKWWARNPDALVAIGLQRSGLFVLDGDRHADADGVIHHDGVDALRGLLADYDLSRHPITHTAGGGVHIYFKNTPGLGCSRGNLPKGIDTKGAGGTFGGYCIAPCTLKDGKYYRPAGACLVDDYEDIPPVPEFLIRIIRPPVTKYFPKPLQTSHVASGDKDRRWALGALRGAASDLAATSANRNEALNRNAFRLGTMAREGWLEPNEVREALWSACGANGLLADPKDGPAVTRASLESGLSAGLRTPFSGARR